VNPACAKQKQNISNSYKKHKMRGGFYIVYAVLFILSLGLACAFYLSQSHHRSYTHSTLHAKIQLQLYTRSLANMLTLCLKERDFNSCKRQEFVFPQDYRFRTTLTEIAPQTFLLDIHGKVLHPSNANTLRVSKRYVLLLP